MNYKTAAEEFEEHKKEFVRILTHYFWSRIAVALCVIAVGSLIGYAFAHC